MAKATYERKIITPAVKEVAEETVTLVLTMEEAQVLRDIYGSGIIGCGRRKFTDSVFNALINILPLVSFPKDFVGHLTFFTR